LGLRLTLGLVFICDSVRFSVGPSCTKIRHKYLKVNINITATVQQIIWDRRPENYQNELHLDN